MSRATTTECRMTPEEVAEIMCIGPETVRAGIISGVFAAWGQAIPGGAGSYRYIIVRERFMAWWNAKDLILAKGSEAS